MAGTLTPTPFQTVLDDTGVASPGALIYTYTAGTTTAAATYTTSALSVANANPIVADSAGRYVAYLAAGANMKFVYKTAAGATIRTQDNVLSVPGAAVNLDIQGTVGVAVTAGQVCYLSSGAEATPLTPGLWYLTDADFAVSSTTCQSIGMAVSAIPINTAGTIRLAGLADTAAAVVVGSTYYVSATAGAITTTAPALARVVGVADTTSTLILAATSAVSSTLPNPISQDLLFTDATYDIGKSGASRPRDLFQSRNATIGGTLAVTGATTLSSTLASGALTVTGNETVSGTLGVTGAATLSSTVATGALTVTGNETVSGTLGVTGAATLSSTVATGALTVTGNETVSGTLGVTGATSLSSATVSSTLGVTGAATLSSTLAVTGATTLTGGLNTPLVVAQGGSGVATHTAYGVIVGGTTSTAATQTVTPGASGTVLTSGGASAVPTWATASSGLSQSFLGLSLRTSPDANLAATTVTMLNCNNIVCSNGVQRTPANNLAATITTSGINGLRASQAEAASTWYKIMYCYGSSGEGLYLEQALDYYADQSFATTDTGSRLNRASAPTTTKLAQSFQTATTGYVPFVDVLLLKANSPTGQAYYTLEADSAGSPSGTPLATSDKLDLSLVSTSNQWVRFIFRTPVSLTASTTYWLVLQGQNLSAASDTANLTWRANSTGGYASGSAKDYSAGAWGTSGVGAGVDFDFKVYVTRNDNTVTPPTGYNTGYAQIGWVRNNGSSNFVGFVSYDRDVRSADFPTIIATAATIPTLADVDTAAPPVSVRLSWDYYNTTTFAIGAVKSQIAGSYSPGSAQMQATSAAGTDRWPQGESFHEFNAGYFQVVSGTGTFAAAGYKW